MTHKGEGDGRGVYGGAKVEVKTWKTVDQCFMAVQMKLLECARVENATAPNGKITKNLLESLCNSKAVLDGLMPDLKKLATAPSPNQ